MSSKKVLWMSIITNKTKQGYKNFIFNHIPSLEIWCLNSKIKKLEMLYDKDIEQVKNYQEKEELVYSAMFERDEYKEKIYRIKSLVITHRGERCNLDISDLPLPPGQSSHWIRGNYGLIYIDQKSYRDFLKVIETVEYEKRKRKFERGDFWIRLFTALVATLAAIASIINLIRHW